MSDLLTKDKLLFFNFYEKDGVPHIRERCSYFMDMVEDFAGVEIDL